jgi:hypothetical protein
MTDLEINKALALAIGWNLEHLKVTDAVFARWDGYWRVFDHRDWDVIGPIAERYDAFPMVTAYHADQWAIVTDKVEVFADTPQKAIALAVIGAKKFQIFYPEGYYD